MGPWWLSVHRPRFGSGSPLTACETGLPGGGHVHPLILTLLGYKMSEYGPLLPEGHGGHREQCSVVSSAVPTACKSWHPTSKHFSLHLCLSMPIATTLMQASVTACFLRHKSHNITSCLGLCVH